MTKNKNTKKGMAKKTLSMSLVVAMLATSNVPVWAAEFSDGTDVSVASEAEAPVAETADEFTDDAVATADTAEAPAVDDGTEADVATATESSVYDDSAIANFKLANVNKDDANGEWGTRINLPSNSFKFKDGYEDVKGAVYAYWTFTDENGIQQYGDDIVAKFNKSTGFEEVIKAINVAAPTPSKEDYINGVKFGLHVMLQANGVGNFEQVYDFGKAKPINLNRRSFNSKTANFKDNVTFENPTYNGKEQKPEPNKADPKKNILTSVGPDKESLTVNDFSWDYVRNIKGVNNLFDADKNVGGEQVAVTAKVTKPGYTGTFKIEKAFGIWLKEIDANNKDYNISLKKTSYEFTGETIFPANEDITFVDTTTGFDFSAYIENVITEGTDWAAGTEHAASAVLNETKARDLGNGSYQIGNYKFTHNANYIGFGANNKFKVVERNLKTCTVKLNDEYSKQELRNRYTKGALTFKKDTYTLTGADGVELKSIREWGLVEAKLELVEGTTIDNPTFRIVVKPTAKAGKNIVNDCAANIATPKKSLRGCKLYFRKDGSKLGDEITDNSIVRPYTQEKYVLTKSDIFVQDAEELNASGVAAILDNDDFDIECDQTTNAGEHWIKIVGRGDYQGSVLTFKYTVKQAAYKETLTANDSVVVNDSYEKAEDYAKAIGLTVTAQNTAPTPKVFTLGDKDMKVEYSFVGEEDKNGNKNLAHNKIKVKVTIDNNDFLGSPVGNDYDNIEYNKSGKVVITKTVKIVHPSIADATVKVLGDYTFNGKEIIPDVEVTTADGVKLTKGEDYSVAVKHGLHAGVKTAEVVITAIKDCGIKNGKYATYNDGVYYEKGTQNTGTKFTINPAKISDVKAGYAPEYDGAAKEPSVNDLKLTLGTEDVGKYFELATKYASKNYEENTEAGTAIAKLKVVKGYEGDFTADTVDMPFTIKPHTVTEKEFNDSKFVVNTKDGHVIDFIALKDIPYDGTDHTFGTIVYKNTELTKKITGFKEGRDYTVDYVDNKYPDQSGKDGKTAYVYVQLSTRNYVMASSYKDNNNKPVDTTITTQDNKTLKNIASYNAFRITKASLAKADVSVTNPVYDGGNKVAPIVKVTLDGKDLTEGTDYTLEYAADNKYDATDANKVTVKGKGGYIGSSKEATWGVDAKDIASDSVKVTLDKKSYKANEKPEVTVADGKTILTEGTDYTVEYTDMEGGKLTVKGTGNYAKAKEVTYTVAERTNLADVKIKGVDEAYTVTGEKINPVITVVNGNKILTEGEDYTVTYGENTEIGEGSVTITAVEGSVDYTGSQTVKFQIKDYDRANLADATIKGVAEVYTVTGEQIKPEITVISGNEILKEGEDYTVTYGENTAIGEGSVTITAVKGSKKFEGSQEVKFQIKDYDRANLADAIITGVDEAYYVTGEQIKPEVKVVSDNKILTEGEDYTVTYGENTEIGEGTVTITAVEGSKKFTGSQTVTFQIKDYDRADLADAVIEGLKDETVTGEQIKPEIRVVCGNKVLTEGTDYTVSYGENKEVGEGTVTITAVEGSKEYAGSKTVTFNIVKETPAVGQAMISEVRVSGNTVTPVLSGDVDGAVGYDYVIATEEDTQNGRVDISKNVLKTNTNFYYVQEGTYYAYCHAWTRDENGKKVFGEWSNIKKFTVDATTPSKPSIKSVKVSGHTVTVTFTASKDAKGYDVVLGGSVKKVNGENRPVDYGKLVVKNIEDGVYTATFYNVPDGKYYAGVHSYNKSSNDGKKVFSKWGYRKTAISVGKAN